MFKKFLNEVKKEVKTIQNGNKQTVTSKNVVSKSVVDSSDEIVVNQQVGMKELEYTSNGMLIVTTTRNEKIKFHPKGISGNKQQFIEKTVSDREAYLAKKDVFLNKIEEYNKINPNNGVTLKVAERQADSLTSWSGFYIIASSVKPTNGVVTIPNICDIFKPSFTDINATLIVKAEPNTKLKNCVDMFKGIKVKHLDLTQLDFSSFASLKGMFHGHTSSTVNVSNWDINKISDKSLAGVFRYLKVDELIGLNTWDTSSITNYTQIFYSAEIKKMNLSNWNLSSIVTEEQVKQGMPKSCQLFSRAKLGAIDLTNWDVSNAKHLVAWFIDSKIESIGDISKWNVSHIEAFNFLFKNAKISSTVDVSKWAIKPSSSQKDMFVNCSTTIIK